jgi:4-carboxymuconolactone decarboxylase
MSGRLPPLRPEELSEEQRALYDEITGGPRAAGNPLFPLADTEGRLVGPFNAMLFSPALGRPVQALGAAIRYRGQLTPRAREIAILVVAAAWDSAFERYAHERVGAAAGLTEREILALRTGLDPELTDPVERGVREAALALTDRADLDDTRYAAAREVLGEQILFEVSTLVGYYAMLAMQLRLFRVPAPADEARP